MPINLATPVNTGATYDNTKLELQRGNTEFSLKGGGAVVTTEDGWTGSSNVWANYTLRVAIPASDVLLNATSLKVTLRSGAAEGLKLDKVYVGHAGTAPNFDGGQVEVLFSGASGCDIPSNSTLQSDTVVFTVDETKVLILAYDVSSDTAKDTIRVRASTKTGWNAYYKDMGGTDDAMNTNMSAGYSTVADSNWGIDGVIAFFPTDSPTADPIFLSDSGSTSTVWDYSRDILNENLGSETGSVKYQHADEDGLLVSASSAAWDESIDPDFTVTTEANRFITGESANKVIVAVDASAGDKITDAIASTNLSGHKGIAMWVESSINLAAGDLQFLLDDTANCASPLETINFPALTANKPKFCWFPFVTPANLTAIISLGIKYNVDVGAMIFYFGNVHALICSYNGSWLTAAQWATEADSTKRFKIGKAQFISNGTHDASLADSLFIATLPVGGGGSGALSIKTGGQL